MGFIMGKRSRVGVLKRQREAKKAEKAAQRREVREARREAARSSEGTQVANRDDLAGYGLLEEEPEEEKGSEQ
jgi:hypothetical protein